jgi:hypothetical protein
MTTKPLKKGATYDDLRDVPDHYVARCSTASSTLRHDPRFRTLRLRPCSAPSSAVRFTALGLVAG